MDNLLKGRAEINQPHIKKNIENNDKLDTKIDLI